MDLNTEKHGYAPLAAMAIHGFCTTLAHGIYTVTAIMEYKGSRELGDMRVTYHQELRTKPEVVAYLWAGDRVALLEHDTTPTRLPTCELRIFIHLLINNWPRPQYGWVTYSPVPNTTWLCREQHLMLHTAAPADPYYTSVYAPPASVSLSSASPAAINTSKHYSPPDLDAETLTPSDLLPSSTSSSPTTNTQHNDHPF